MTCDFEEEYSEDKEDFHYKAVVQKRHTRKYLGFNSRKGMRAKDIKNMKNRKKDCYTFRKYDVPQDYIDSMKERNSKQTRHKDKNTVKSQSVKKRCQQTPGQGPAGVDLCDRQKFEALISGHLESVRHEQQDQKRHSTT